MLAGLRLLKGNHENRSVPIAGNVRRERMAVAPAGAQRANPGDVVGIVHEAAVVHPHRAPVLQGRG